MVFDKLKDKALRAALPLLSTSRIGRMVVDKGIDIVSRKTGLPMQAIYDREDERWTLELGKPEAPMSVTLRMTSDCFADILEQIVPDVLQNRPISRERIMSLLQQYLVAQEPGRVE